MAEQIYICRRWPFYQIGSDIKFSYGAFATDDESVQKRLESNEEFGVHIFHAQKAQADEPIVHGIDPGENAPPPVSVNAIVGARGTKRRK